MRASKFLLLLLLFAAIPGCTQKAAEPQPQVQVITGEPGVTSRNGDLRSFQVSANFLRDNSTGLKKGTILWIIPKDMDGYNTPISGTIDLTLYNLRELRTLREGIKEYAKGAPVYQKRIIVAPTHSDIVVEIPWEEVAEYPLSRQNFGVARIDVKDNDGTELRQDYGDMYAVTSDIIWLRDPGYGGKAVEEERFAKVKRYYRFIVYQFTKLVYDRDYTTTVEDVAVEGPMPAGLGARLNITLATLKEAQEYADGGNLSLAVSRYSGVELELKELLEEPGVPEKERSNLRHLSNFAEHRGLAYGKELAAEEMLPQINASRKKCSEEKDCEEYRTLMSDYNALKREASERLTLAKEELSSIVGWEHLELPGR